MKNLGTILFNIAELLVIILIGLLFKVSLNLCIFMCTTFFLVRMTAGKPMHYKAWYRCAIWSLLTFLSLYLLSDLNIIVTLLLTIFTSLISTGKADISGMFMWKGKETQANMKMYRNM